MILGIVSKCMRNKLMVITGLATVFVVGATLAGFWHAWSSISSFNAITDGAIANERTVLIMTADFKKQVQEWKDTLLRGSDPQKLDKYWGNFVKQEAPVQELGTTLLTRLINPETRQLVEQFLSAHKTMGVAYRTGLDKFKASGFVSHVGDTAVAGIDRAPTQLLEKAAEVMHKLEEHSTAIGSVLDVIRDIAEQSNLLALNAAIEAARAGEQGRGYAVVAAEVRTLAQRSQQSTSEIQNMIEHLQSGTREAATVMSESRGRAAPTVEQAMKAGEALEKIANAISAISDMNSQIVTAAEEIGRNITIISQAAEQSAESVQQTATSSEALSQLANELQVVASRFQI